MCIIGYFEAYSCRNSGKFQVPMERSWLCFKGFRMVFIVGIAFPALIIVALVHQNSIFDLVEGFSQINASRGNAENATTNVIKEEAQNVSAPASEGEDQNITRSQVGTGEKAQDGIPGVLKERAQENATSYSVPKYHSLAHLKNDSSLSTSIANDELPLNLQSSPKDLRLTDLKKDSSLSTSIANDKLLEGLVASTFNEGPCLSRYQSYLYRKVSPHKPSLYLKSKLRSYEHLHKSCGPHTKFYKRTMRKGLESSNNINADAKCKYLVWTASNGLGNRMITLAAAFLYAILTDRVLLVRFGTDMVGLFCEPFPDSSWLLPKDFPYWKDQKHLQTYENIMKDDKANTSKDFPSSFLLLNLQHSLLKVDNRETFFQCDKSQIILHKITVLILSSDQCFVPSLFMISSFKQELSKMFPEKDTVFHHLGRYLLHPSNEAWQLISKFYDTYMAKADERIGLQIRVFNPRRAPHQTIINEILSCAVKHKLLPEVDMQKKSALSLLEKKKSKAVLVASLYSEYGEKLRAVYLTNTNVTGQAIRVYQPSHEEHQKKNDNMHNMKALTEIYLLSFCDALVTSPKSTFGYVAHGLGGLKPLILQKAYGEKIPNPPCRRAISMEPCFHYPHKHYCSAQSIVNVTSLFPYIRYCEDVSSGMKLVNDHR